MASIDNVVRITVEIIDKASSEIKQIQSEIDSSLQQVKGSAESTKKSLSMDEVASSLKKVSNELVALGTAGMGVATAVTYLGLELNKSVAAAGSVAGATAEQMKELEAIARDVGRTTIVSAKEAADGMYYLASAGLKVNEIMEAIRPVTQLAGATFSDMALATQIVVNTLSQFGLEASEAGRVADVLTTAVSNSQATVEKLSYSLRYAGPVANAFNISLEETVAALMLFYNAGLSGEQAGTALRNILVSLADPSKEAAETIASLGLALEQVDPSKYSLQDIAKRFAEAGATAQDLANIVGREAVAAMLTLMKNSDDLSKLTQLLEQNRGAAQKLSEEMAKTPYGQYQIAVNQLKEMAYNAFPAVFEALKVLLQPLMNLVNWFNSLNSSTKEGIAQFVVFGSTIALFLGGLGKTIATIIELEKALKTLRAIDLVGTLKNWQGAFATFASSAIGQLTMVTSAVGLLIFNISQAIQLTKALGELFKIKQETAAIKQTADLFENLNRIQKELIATDKRAMEDLAQTAKALYEKGIVKSMAEAQLLALALDESGPLGEFLKSRPDLRRFAEQKLLEYNVKIKLDASEFEYEWRRVGEKLRDQILQDVKKLGW